jgi:hypothetical protein
MFVQHELGVDGELTVPVGVDHGQFIACDPDAELDIDSYGDAAQRAGLATWRSGAGVTVFTASHWTDTVVTVRLTRERPTLAEDDWDHVVEAGLVLRRGRLHLYGPEDTGVNEHSIALRPSTYALLVCGRDFDSVNECGDDGNDSYALLLWPGPVFERRVLKDGFSRTD